MPAGPTPIYIVKFDGNQFPGYVQSDPQKLAFKNTAQNILNRNGGSMSLHGAELRSVSLQFIVMSRLDNVTDLEHLDDCKDQYREAMAIMARVTGPKQLKVGDQDRYLSAIPVGISAEFVAGTSRSLRYTTEFLCEPYYVDVTPVTGSFTGNGTVTLTLPDTRETYPRFDVPSTVTAFTATHTESGKVVEFVRGSVSGDIIIRCARFEVIKTSGGDASVTMANVDFGIKHTTGAGDFDLDITDFAGSGTVDVEVHPRYEL